MTPQEIQALINAKIAGQGSAVDVGGALPQILSGILELAQAGENAPKPIVITDMPSDGDTLQDVFGYGLTLEEIEAASQGKRTGVVYNGIFYMITYAKFANADSWGISFEFYYRDDDATLILAQNCSLWYEDGNIVIKNSEP